MRKFIFILLITGLVTGFVHSGEISVTEVEVKGNEARVIINNIIEINGIKIKKGDVNFPVYISKSGKVFPQVRFLTKDARNIVVDAISNRKASKEIIKKINYKITKMSPYSKKGSSLKAFAAVTFNGVVEVECKVMKARYKKKDYWVAWPARPPDKNKGENKWQDQISIINKKIKSIVEKDIIDSMKKMFSGGVTMTDIDVDIKKGMINVPLTVTDVKVKKISGEGELIAIAQVDLNYSFRIMDIKLYNRREQMVLEFPVYVSKKGKEYGQIRIFSRKLRREIKNAINTGNPSEYKSKSIGFEITKFEEPWQESALKYFSAVTLNGAVEIECKIMDSADYDAFVGWPSSKEGGKYVDKIIPCNLKVKKVIEKALLDKYHGRY